MVDGKKESGDAMLWIFLYCCIFGVNDLLQAYIPLRAVHDKNNENYFTSPPLN